ncbi:MAG: hypothetical protein ACREEN_02970, partial [Stellaceae bacterium]
MTNTTGRLSWGHLWLSPDGRATRFDYWLRFTVPYLIGFVVAGILDGILGTANPNGGVGIVTALYIV